MIYGIFLLLIIFLIVSVLKDKDILSPRVLFNLIWLFILGLYQLRLSYWQQDLSSRTLLIFLCCIISFNISSLFFSMFKINKVRFLKREKNNNQFSNRVFKINIFILILFVIEVIYSKGFPLLWKFTDSTKSYMDFGIPSLHGALSGLIICLGAYYMLKKSKLKWVYLLFGILILSRQVIISMILEGIVFNIKVIQDKLKTINIKKYAFLLLIIIVLFGVFGNFRSGSQRMSNLFRPKPEYQEIPSSIMWSYSYLTFSISNFNNLVSITDGGINKGATILNDLLPSIVLKSVNIEEEFRSNYLINSNFTVSTYLADVYVDFGILGIIIMNMIIALLGIYYYKQTRYESNDKNNLLYAIFAHNLIFLFFNNMFIYLPIVIQIVYVNLIFDGGVEYENCNI